LEVAEKARKIMLNPMSQPTGVVVKIRTVPDNKSRNIPEFVLVRRWAVGVLGIWRGGVGWVRVGQMGSVYKQPETEVDDSCHS
jgi:hypothetical protein